MPCCSWSRRCASTAATKRCWPCCAGSSGAAGSQQGRSVGRQEPAVAVHRTAGYPLCLRCHRAGQRPAGLHLDGLLLALRERLPQGEPIFDVDEITDRSERFLAAEILREKVFRLSGDEIPYSISVEIEKFEAEGDLRRIFAAIIVDKDTQKPILIGKKGAKLKEISSQARLDMEKLFDGKSILKCG